MDKNKKKRKKAFFSIQNLSQEINILDFGYHWN